MSLRRLAWLIGWISSMLFSMGLRLAIDSGWGWTVTLWLASLLVSVVGMHALTHAEQPRTEDAS